MTGGITTAAVTRRIRRLLALPGAGLGAGSAAGAGAISGAGAGSRAPAPGAQLAPLPLEALGQRGGDPGGHGGARAGGQHELLVDGGEQVEPRGAGRRVLGKREPLGAGQADEGNRKRVAAFGRAARDAPAHALAMVSARAPLRDSRILPEGSMSMHFASTSSPSETTSVTLSTRLCARWLMWISPSVPGKISQNAPNSTTRFTLVR